MFKFISLAVLYLMFVWFLLQVDSKQKHPRYKLKAVDIQWNKSWLSNVTYSLKPVSLTKSLFNAYFEIAQPFNYLNFKFQLFKRYNGWRPYMVNTITIPGCKILKGLMTNIVSRIMMPTIKKYTSVNHTCPYTDFIIIKDADLDMINFGSSVIPLGQYRFQYDHYEKKNEYVSTIVFDTEVYEDYA